MLEVEVFREACDRMRQIADAEETLREIWREITGAAPALQVSARAFVRNSPHAAAGTGLAKSHNVMHMEHKHGSTNQLAAALFEWLQEEHTGVVGG